MTRRRKIAIRKSFASHQTTPLTRPTPHVGRANVKYDPALTVAEIAERLRVSRPKVYDLALRDPSFRVFRVGRQVRMKLSALEAWIHQQEDQRG